jgi:CxxC motif-containing protein (DUF1111 family)
MVEGPAFSTGCLTVTDAIRAHGGEAARSRDESGKLSDQEKAAIVAFLNSS